MSTLPISVGPGGAAFDPFALFAMLSAPAADPVAGADAVRPRDEAQVLRWVRAAQAGDRDAEAALYRAYAPTIYRTLRALSATDADAEELLQDTFVKALGNLDGYRPREGARFVSWLITIARNAYFRRRRKLGRLVPLEPVVLERDGAAPSADAAHDLRSALLRVLAELPERDRWIVTLRYAAELSAEEVADECGVTAAAIRKVTQRQRVYLRARLETMGFEQEDLP